MTSTASTSIVAAETTARRPEQAAAPRTEQGDRGDDRDEQRDRGDDREHRAGKRHHGSRLARNVDTGTVAAMIATRRTTRSSRSRGPRGARSPPPDHGDERVDEDLDADPAVEERRDQAVHLVGGLVVVDQARSRSAAAQVPSAGSARSGLPLTAAGSGGPARARIVAVRSASCTSPACRVEVDSRVPAPTSGPAQRREPQPLAGTGVREARDEHVRVRGAAASTCPIRASTARTCAAREVVGRTSSRGSTSAGSRTVADVDQRRRAGRQAGGQRAGSYGA